MIPLRLGGSMTGGRRWLLLKPGLKAPNECRRKNLSTKLWQITSNGVRGYPRFLIGLLTIMYASLLQDLVIPSMIVR